MTVFNYINTNIERIKYDVSIGIIEPCVIRRYEIYCRYDYYRKQGYGIMDSALYAGDDFHITDKRVYAIRRKMESEIN